jgi:CopG antitoxin of type II toxin-antitoxin system
LVVAIPTAWLQSCSAKYQELQVAFTIHSVPGRLIERSVRFMSQKDEADCPQPTVNLGYPTPAHGKIPAFNNIEEEAEFWDTHSFVDYLEDFEPVNTQWVKMAPSPLSVRLDSRDRAELTMIAHERGIGPSTLVRMWIKERLKEERKAS